MSVPNTPHAKHETDTHETDSHADDAVEDELDPNEPHTPGWLTLLGCGLFLLAGIVALATDEPDAAQSAPTAAAEVAAPEPVVQPAAPPPATAPGAQLKDPQAARAAAQKLIEQLKLRQVPGGAGIQPPQPAGH